MKLVFTILAIVPYFIGFFPYLKDIHTRRVQPHVMSWIGWGLTTLLAFFAMLADVFNWAAFVVLANAIACFTVVIYSYVRGVAITVFSRYDTLFFIFGFIGVLLWQYLDNPDFAIVFAILADLSFGIPTIMKTYKKPSSETLLPWSMATLSGFFSIFAISYVSFTEIAFPVYLFFYDLIIFMIVVGWVQQKKKV
ncbi:hypothetical protein KC901_00085 [Patescibacteria group bacterium]|nr:hypothetical protein [Patescibacteria group bacterium]